SLCSTYLCSSLCGGTTKEAKKKQKRQPTCHNRLLPPLRRTAVGTCSSRPQSSQVCSHLLQHWWCWLLRKARGYAAFVHGCCLPTPN
ncbi:unnamed protein product, partial [Ixodes pacificus]